MRRATVAVAATTLLASGCGGAGGSTTVADAASGGQVATLVASADATTATTSTTTTSTTTTSTVDEPAEPTDLSDVAVPGACVTVTFTPPSASTARLAELCTPDGALRDTAVVLVHGGAGVSGSRTDLTAWQEWYASNGYMTLSVDYDLVDPDTDSGVYPLPEQNVKAGVQYLRMVATTMGVDSIVVQGHSAGARLAAIVATTGDDPAFAGDEVWPGVSDAVDGTIGFYGYYDGAQFNGAAYYGGDGSPASSASATTNAGRVHGWTILVHGTADSIVGVTASEEYATALESVGAPVDLIEIDGAEHGLDGYDTEQLTDIGLQLAEVIAETIETSDVA